MSNSSRDNFSKQQPRVSVIVPIYNGENDLPDLISCLEQQSYPANLVEYLLIDNNSSDRTEKILEKASRSSKLSLFPLTEIKIQSSYAARNQGIRSAQGEIIAFTDVDCRPQPTWLENLLKPFTQPEVGIVAGEILAIPGKNIFEKYAERKNFLSQKFTLEHSFCPYGQTANLAIRKTAFLQVGLFRPYLTTGGDADICWRILKETNWQLEFAPEASVRHRHRATLQELRSQWRRYGRSNRYLHELYGVELMRELNTKEYLYRLSRWLLKELPVNGIKAIVSQADPLDLITTPLDLICVQARTTGQRQSQLSEAAQKIAWLEGEEVE